MHGDQRGYYQRQIALSEIGAAGQERLGRARVLVVGVGGLGCPAATYLAAAGLGTVGLVDHDVVSLHNLHRQILFSEGEVGKPKVKVAESRLKALNPLVNVVTVPLKIDRSNAGAMVEAFDIVVDGTDNFPTRILLSETCRAKGLPYVMGSVLGFAAQVSLFAPEGPCYRCLYPEMPSPEIAPSCHQAGVVGAVTGVVGAIQALEVIKWVLGAGAALQGRLLCLDLLNMSVEELTFAPRPDCPHCRGTVRGTSLAGEQWREWSAGELRGEMARGVRIRLIDVRSREEHLAGALPDSLNFPVEEIQKSDFDQTLKAGGVTNVVYCARGQRSLQALPILAQKGLSNLVNLSGGFEAWQNV